MPGHVYVTQATPDHLMEVAGGVAAAFGYEIQQEGSWTLRLKKGSLAASFFVGAFVAYCDFRLNIVFPGDGTAHLHLERNTPWWTGIFGVNRVKNQARELADAYGNELVRQSVAILQRNDF